MKTVTASGKSVDGSHGCVPVVSVLVVAVSDAKKNVFFGSVFFLLKYIYIFF